MKLANSKQPDSDSHTSAAALHVGATDYICPHWVNCTVPLKWLENIHYFVYCSYYFLVFRHFCHMFLELSYSDVLLFYLLTTYKAP